MKLFSSTTRGFGFVIFSSIESLWIAESLSSDLLKWESLPKFVSFILPRLKAEFFLFCKPFLDFTISLWSSVSCELPKLPISRRDSSTLECVSYRDSMGASTPWIAKSWLAVFMPSITCTFGMIWVTGDYYPTDILLLLKVCSRQLGDPVNWVEFMGENLVVFRSYFLWIFELIFLSARTDKSLFILSKLIFLSIVSSCSLDCFLTSFSFYFSSSSILCWTCVFFSLSSMLNFWIVPRFCDEK